MRDTRYPVLVIGAGHAGAEAAWAAANLLGAPSSVALVTLRRDTIGVMSCNPAIGGLAKGQLVREIDAMGGLMGLAADATGINFKLLNTSKGPAVRGPRCQSDKHAYARTVQTMLEARDEIDIIEAAVEDLIVEDQTVQGGTIRGVRIRDAAGDERTLTGGSVVLTTGTFMRGLMHQGEDTTPGGRAGEAPASPISGALTRLGFELGRLRTGTPPRLRRSSIAWDDLEPQHPDPDPVPFSELSRAGWSLGPLNIDRFPFAEPIACRQTRTAPEAHALIRENLHRAPMHSGQIEGRGPRYCPSIEDKVVRFAQRTSHGVFLEPESHTSDWVYCNGIATSLPTDIQDTVVRTMPGCERAEILQHGYAVEYDMVRPHQILVTGETRRVAGLFLAGQINGTSGYEEAAAQGLVAGINAAARALNAPAFTLERSQAYIGVLMDDLVTKTPVEPYRMFTSRAEYRLMLRADNAPDRLTPIADDLGLLGSHDLGRRRRERFAARTHALRVGRALMRTTRTGDKSVHDRALEASFGPEHLEAAIGDAMQNELGELEPGGVDQSVYATLHAERRYEPYIERQRREIRRLGEIEHTNLPTGLDYERLDALRTEARAALARFRPATFGQASRLEGVTPADLTLLRVLAARGPIGAAS